MVMDHGHEMIVRYPGIVEIRWYSDDPDYYQEPIDLFDKQNDGLPDDYGRRDDQTTERAWFKCNVCQVEFNNFDSLKAHLRSARHSLGVWRKILKER